MELMLEGQAGHRYEKHVFIRLKDVRDGNRKNYENITDFNTS